MAPIHKEVRNPEEESQSTGDRPETILTLLINRHRTKLLLIHLKRDQHVINPKVVHTEGNLKVVLTRAVPKVVRLTEENPKEDLRVATLLRVVLTEVGIHPRAGTFHKVGAHLRAENRVIQATSPVQRGLDHAGRGIIVSKSARYKPSIQVE